MNNNPFVLQPTHISQQPHLPPGQPLTQPPQPGSFESWATAQHSHVQTSPAPVHNPGPQLPRLPPPEQSVLYTNYDCSPERQGQQLRFQRDQNCAPPPVTQHAASPQPQLPCTSPLQSQQQRQQKRLHHTSRQHLMPAKRRRLDSQDLNSHYAHSQPQSPLPSFAQNTEVYPDQDQAPCPGDGSGGLNNTQFDANKEDAGRNCGGMKGRGRGARRGLMTGGMARKARRYGYMGSGSGSKQGGQSSGGGIHARGSGRKFGSATSMQAGGCDSSPNIVKLAVVPVAKQLQGAQGFTISGGSILTNIGTNPGVNNVTTVNNYGGTHGLEDLKDFVSFTALYNSSAQDRDRQCHPGTRENVLSRLRYWIDKPDAPERLCWLYGPAGAGKSAIAQTIAHEYNQGEVVATFFFFRSDSGRNDGNRLFTTIAWQLAFSIPAAKDFIVHALDKIPHLPMTDVETQFEQLVAQIFQPTNNIASQMRHPTPVVIIDGIDECSDERLQQRILAVIGNTVNNSRVPLRFLISSRPEALIEETFNQFQEFTFRIDLATLDDSNRDIEKYFMDRFSTIASKQGLIPIWPGQEIIQEFVFKSSGNFIFASAVVRYLSDEDYSAVSRLDIVRNLKPCGTVSPFALLDELYLGVLKQPRDQDFLKAFLVLLVGRSSVGGSNLREDDAVLMKVSEKELHLKLRRMRSLLKIEPFINVYHKSFLDFLHDSSRSGQYHVSKQNGLKRYLELIVDSVVRHVSVAIEDSNNHETCCSSFQFKSIVNYDSPMIKLPVEEWQEALKPLLHLQGKLLTTSKLQPCRVLQVMRDLQLHLAILQQISHLIATAPVPESNMRQAVVEWSPAVVTGAMQNMSENGLNSCLSMLVSYLQKSDSLLMVDAAIIERISSFLAVETAARVQTVSDAQKLIDVIDLMTNNPSFLNQCGPDARRKAAHLASEVLARVPLLPASFLDRSTHYIDPSPLATGYNLEFVCQSVFISKILDPDYIIPLLGIYDKKEDRLRFVRGAVTENNEPVDEWLERSNPDLVTRIRAILEVARTIRYIHSMNVALHSTYIESKHFFLDLNQNLRAKFLFFGLFAWWPREATIYGYKDSNISDNCMYESNVFAFGRLFHSVCFLKYEHILPQYSRVQGNARQLIKRCRVKDPKSRPAMGDVVKEMETWDLT